MKCTLSFFYTYQLFSDFLGLFPCIWTSSFPSPISLYYIVILAQPWVSVIYLHLRWLFPSWKSFWILLYLFTSSCSLSHFFRVFSFMHHNCVYSSVLYFYFFVSIYLCFVAFCHVFLFVNNFVLYHLEFFYSISVNLASLIFKSVRYSYYFN